MPDANKATQIIPMDTQTQPNAQGAVSSNNNNGILPPGTTDGQIKPPTPGLWTRTVQGVRYALTGQPLGWFGPGQPIRPMAQEETQGRRYDFRTGVNYNVRPRADEVITFPMLRSLADNYDMLRLVIETRKDQLAKMTYEIRMKDKKSAPDVARLNKLRNLFRYPDNEHDFHTWFRAIAEDMLVIDAPSIEPRFNMFNEIVGLDWIDGATVRLVIDEYGRTPLPPDPAYQQILKGVPANNFSRDQLIYRPRNLRTNKLYGYSPVEQIIVTVNIAMRRQIWQLQGYTEGNVPEAVVEMPADWNLDQVAQFQGWWDSLLEGNTAEQRHMKFIPGPAKMTFTKPVEFKNDYDEWLARVVCYALSVSPQAFVAIMNRATAESASQQAIEEGLQPLLLWSKGVFDYVIEKFFGWNDIEFIWEMQKDVDELKRAQANQIYINAGVLGIDEVREDLGKEPLGVPFGVMTANGFMKIPTRDQAGDMRIAPPAIPALTPPPGEAKIDGLDNINLEGQKKLDGGDTAKKAEGRVVKITRPDNSETERSVKSIMVDFFNAIKPDIAKQVAEAFDNVDKAKGKVDRIIDAINTDGFSAIVGPLDEQLVKAVKKSGASTLAIIAVGDPNIETLLNQVNEVAVIYARERSAELVGMRVASNGKLVVNPNPEFAITDSTREMLRGDIQTAIEEGWSSGKLKNMIEDNYAFSEQRAETIARTEIGFANAGGNYASMKASGRVAQKRNLLGSEHDDGRWDICNDATEEDWIPFDQPFVSGELAPPHHPNCICDFETTLIGEEEESQGGGFGEGLLPGTLDEE